MSSINPLTGKKYPAETIAINKKFQRDLPIFRDDVASKFREYIDMSDVLIIESSTGSGKSIGTPVLALQHFNYDAFIIITQPRTINIENNAEIIAKQLGVEVGREVGYLYGAGRKYTPGVTKIVVIIDTIYTRITALMEREEAEAREEMDKLGITKEDVDQFRRTNIIMIDELHERSLPIDLILASAYQYFLHNHELPSLRPRKYILLSATIDVEFYREYFARTGANVNVLSVFGQTFPIKHYYLAKSVGNISGDIDFTYMEALKSAILAKIGDILRDTGGHCNILIFLPVTSLCYTMVVACEKALGKYYTGTYVEALERGSDEKVKAFIIGDKYTDSISGKTRDIAMFEPGAYRRHFGVANPKAIGDTIRRKIIFSTPISETGITVRDITYVIDSGLVNFVYYDAESGRKYRDIRPTSKASIIQRCGRSGRLAPGTCMHMYTYGDYTTANIFAESIVPEIYRSEYHKFIIDLIKIYGDTKNVINIVQALPNNINNMALSRTLQELYDDGVIFNRRLSQLGTVATDLGVDYRLGLAIILAIRQDVVDIILPIVAFIQVDSDPTHWYIDENTMVNFKSRHRNSVGKLMVFYNIWREFMVNCRVKSEKKVYQFCEKYKYNYNLFIKFLILIRKIQSRLHQRKYKKTVQRLDTGTTISGFSVEDKIRYIFMMIYHNNRIIADGDDGEYQIYRENYKLKSIKMPFLLGTINPSIIGYIDIIWQKKTMPIISMPFVISVVKCR